MVIQLFKRTLLLAGFLLMALALSAGPARGDTAANDPHRKEWIQLFNGRDLNDWLIKFAGHELGENSMTLSALRTDC